MAEIRSDMEAQVQSGITPLAWGAWVTVGRTPHDWDGILAQLEGGRLLWGAQIAKGEAGCETPILEMGWPKTTYFGPHGLPSKIPQGTRLAARYASEMPEHKATIIVQMPAPLEGEWPTR